MKEKEEMVVENKPVVSSSFERTEIKGTVAEETRQRMKRKLTIGETSLETNIVRRRASNVSA